MAGKKGKVVVAMSGGVDSSVAACLLVEQGYDVIGLFMRVGVPEPESTELAGVTDTAALGGGEAAQASETPRGLKPAAHNDGVRSHRTHQGCCSASDAADARFVAGMLGIPFYALNFQEDFDGIIDYFADEYVRGRTPNPCVVCNDRLKFGRLLDYADAVGAKYIATGHYARIGKQSGHGGDSACNCETRSPSSPFDICYSPFDIRHSTFPLPPHVLLRGRDEGKDQSYVLFGLDRGILDRILFPVGDLIKSEVRDLAARFDLPNRDKPDSVEICFAPDRDYVRVVRERRPEAFIEGDVLDPDGRVIGRHKGIAQYTIGQRRGLGIAAGKPIYVTQLDVLNNTVTMGERDALLAPALIADRANFLVDLPNGPIRAQVKIRYLHKAAPATIQRMGTGDIPDGGVDMPTGSEKVRVVFDEPQRAITPGQAVVFYDDDLVLGGAWILNAEL